MFKSTAAAAPVAGKSEQTRRRLLEAALALFRADGFEATTMRDIGAKAGTSLGATYYYFPSKEAIVAAYYDFVQQEHQARTRRALSAAHALRERLRVVMHTKIDILQDDRRLLVALFRYGGDPDHPLSWFGPGTRRERELTMALFEDAIAHERFPADVRELAPVLLWTLHMGILLYFVYDTSPGQQRTRRLIDAAVAFVDEARRFVAFPLLRPARRRVLNILREAELLPPREVSS